MQVIIFPINPKDTGKEVSNLQAALQLFLDRKIIATFQPPDHPTEEEIVKLRELLKNEIDAFEFDDATRKLVLYFQLQQGLSDTYNGAVEENTAAKINEILKALGAFDDAKNKYIVKGFIRNADGTGFANAIVKAFDRDLRRYDLLGKTTTGKDGYYEITYSQQQSSNAEIGNADLQVLVYETINDDEKKPLLTSDIFFNASPVQEINFTLPPAPVVKEKSEWEKINEQVLPLLKGQKQKKEALNVYEDLLPEELTQDDIAFIAKEAGLDKNNIQLWSLAYGRSTKVNLIAPVIFYGWFRMGQPTDLKDLLAKTAEELYKSLQQSVIKNYIPEISGEHEKNLSLSIDQARLDFHLEPAKEGEKAGVGDIINLTLKDKAGIDWFTPEKKKIFIDIFKQTDPDVHDFLEKIKTISTVPSQQISLQKALRLDKLTMSHPALMEALHPLVAEENDASLKPLAFIAKDQWIDLAYTHGTPAKTNLAPEDYATQIANNVEDRLPTASLANKISNVEILFNQPGIENISSLIKTLTDFDIVNDDVSIIAGKYQLDDESKGLLKSLQNIKKMGIRWEDADAFIDNCVTSIAKMVEYSPQQLKTILQDDVSPENVAIIHANAVAAQNIGIGLMGYLQPAMYGVKVYVMQSLNSIEHVDPTLRSLFTGLEQCACEPCLSVLSPAAYYTDLLNYIDHSGNGGAVLQSIRPDLYDLELSCNNSQIELPHIDLVLEILENKVVFPYPVKLPAGVSIMDELTKSNNIGDELKKVLQETAEEKLESVTAKKDAASDYAWVLKDSYRTWMLNVQKEETMSTVNSRKIVPAYRFDITKLDTVKLLSWLNSDKAIINNIPADIKTAFENELLKKHIDSNMPVSIADYSVVKIGDAGDGFHWKIDYKIASIINIIKSDVDPTKVNIKIEDGNGNRLVNKIYNINTGNATKKQLESGAVRGVINFKKKSNNVRVEPVINGFSVSGNYTLNLFYSPAHLLINALSYQSTKANPNLFAQPQNRNPRAYELLVTDAVYPWSLPYNQPLTETRLLLEKAGTLRLKLLDAVVTEENKFSNVEWATEVLGISVAQQTSIVAIKKDIELYKAWGFIVNIIEGDEFHQYDLIVYDSFQSKKITAEQSFQLFQTVSIVMQQAKIEYTELKSLLISKFINQDNVFISNSQTCSPTEMILRNADNDNSVLDALCDRMHRFIRLWRVLGWSIPQIEQAIMSDKIGAGKIDEDCILHLAQVQMLQQQSGVPLDTVIAFFQPFSSDKIITYTKTGKQIETVSFYERLFQNKLVQNPLNKDFAFSEFNNDVLHPLTHSKTWEELLPFIAASLGILQPSLESFLQSEIFDTTPFNLTLKVNLKHLQFVWQNLSLAKAMQLSIEDFIAANKLIYPPVNPPHSLFDSPLNLLKFIDEIKFIKKAQINISSLEKILSGKNEEDILSVDTAVTILSSLQKELRLIPKISLGNFDLEEIKTELISAPFNISAPDKNIWNETGRWKNWGLKQKAASTNWLVNDPQDQTKEIDLAPLDLLKREDVLIQQINLLLQTRLFKSEDLSALLQLSFVSNNGIYTLKAAVPTGETIGVINNLLPEHLDQIFQLIILAKTTKESFRNLDELIKSLITKGSSPFDKRLTALVENAQNIITQQLEVIVNYFTKLYKCDSASAQRMLSENIMVQIGSADRFNPALKIYSAHQFLSLLDFWGERNALKEKTAVELKGLNEYVILIKLQKIFTLNQFWKATPSQLNWFWIKREIDDIGYLGIMPDLLSSVSGKTSYINWKRSTLLFQTGQMSAEFENMLTNYLAALGDGNSVEKILAARKVLADAFSLEENDVKVGAEKQGMDSLADTDIIEKNLDPIKLRRLINYLSQLQKLGLDNAQYATLTREPATFDSIRIARQILFARYGAGNYPDALQEVNNQLRIQERDRLVEYLVWKENVRDANGLYEKYLIDVEMSACMRTTRLLQSTAAAQLFVHRCLLNLQQEPKVNPEWFNRKRWEWTQNYRVWEANRKVFLYPENWLYPELRDDKTAAFRTFETALTQNEASEKNAIIAFKEYMDTLLGTSQIKMISMHVQSDNGENTLYQLGRSIGSPYNYFWRKCLNFANVGMRWTGWEKIDADISGVHIVIFVHESDLHVAWATITESGDDGTFQFQMSWTRQQTKGWISKKITTEKKFEFTGIPGRETSKQIHLKTFYRNSPFPEIYIYVAENLITLSDVKPNIGNLINGPFSYNVKNSSAYLGKNFIPTLPFLNPNPTDKNFRIVAFFNIFFQYSVANKKYFSPITITKVSLGLKFNIVGSTYSISTLMHKNLNYWYVDLPGNTSTGSYEIKFSVNDGTASFNITTVLSLDRDMEHHYECNQIIELATSPPGYLDNSERTDMLLKAKLKFEPSGSVVLSSFETSFYSFEDDTKLNFPDFPDRILVCDSSSFLELKNEQDGIRNILDKSEAGKFVLLATSGNDNDTNNIWGINENQQSFIKSPDHLINPLPVLPASYSEASLFRKSFSENPPYFFEEEQHYNENNSVFNMRYLADYYNTLSDNIDPRKMNMPAYNLKFPYALYNWEVFFHLPIAAGFFLSKQHRFEEARKWLHYVFDPTTNNSNHDKDRFWRFLPFRNNNQGDTINKLLEVLANPDSTDKEKENIQGQIAAWLSEPFNPFAVARLRINAYEWFTVTSYIKNLIEWGDQLFRRDTKESINEATLLYVMASDILGKRPMSILSTYKSSISLSYRELAGKRIDDFSNTWVTLLDTPYGKKLIEDKAQTSGSKADNDFQIHQLSSIGSTYFCVPPNEKLQELWDTVADRLFKIRNCKNFDGVSRNLPLLDPPIDPELLIRATAAGVSIADALSDMYAPPPLYRFNMVVQKATELCNEVKALGGAMLSAIEKKEAEHLSLLRSGQEIEMQKLVTTVRQAQINEAAATIDALRKSRENIIEKIMYLQRQMGGTEITLNTDGVPILHESYINQPIANFDWTVADLAGLGLTQSETDQVVFMQTNNIFTLIGGGFHTASGLAHTLGASLAIVPSPADGPAKVANATGDALSSYGTFFNTMASHYAMLEKRSGMMAGWQRRRDEWLYQAKSAVLEIMQIDKQIVASEIRKAIAEKELDNHYKQIEHTKTLDDYVRNQKFSNETLYTWMESGLSIVYKSAFDIAYELAKKAEKAFRFELGDDLTHFITSGYWDTMQRGLLAGEGLMHDLKRMEIAFMDRNNRDYEITKHITLAQLDHLALLQLRVGGTCKFNIPEVLFDIDFPGQYFRRIKSVSISLPCIAGPYTSVSGTLSLTGNKLRRSTTTDTAGYTEANLENGYSSNQPSIATSHGQNDNGMFELNFRDERYLPFEGCGAISSWHLELPNTVHQFDYNTIADVVIHLKYTSRFDSSLKDTVTASVSNQLNIIKQNLNERGLYISISLKHDMPNALNLLKKDYTTDIKIESSRLPYFAKSVSFKKIMLSAKENIIILKKDANGAPLIFSQLQENLWQAEFKNEVALNSIVKIELTKSTTETLSEAEIKSLDELIIIVKYEII